MKPHRSDGRKEGFFYTRVSDKSQLERGHGLESQEAIARDLFARMDIGYIGTFSDDLTGRTADRDGIKSLIKALKKERYRAYVFIDDVSRLARNLPAYFSLRYAIVEAGGIIVSPKYGIFSDDPEEDPREVLDAYFASRHRKQNAEQTTRRMRGRCLDGHWCLQLPHGYKYRLKQSKNDRAAILRDEPVATIIQNAIEAYASAHLATQADVARFLASHAEFPKNAHGRVPDQVANNVLKNPLYAGYVHVPHWDVSLRQGHHPALVSFETFQRVQRRLEGNSKGLVRKDNNADFALRGHVVCACCQTRLTSCWAKGGKGKRYAYYHCREKSCEVYGLSIPRDKIEGEFAELLQSLRPVRAMYDLIDDGLRQIWQQQDELAEQRKISLKSEIREVEREAKKLVERVLGTENETLIAAYEKRLFESEARKIELKEQVAKCGTTVGTFDDAFRTAMTFIKNPYNIWVSDRLDLKQTVLKLTFPHRLEYERKSGFRTPLTSSPFTLFDNVKGGSRPMVHPTGATSNPLFHILKEWTEVLRFTSLGGVDPNSAQNDDESAPLTSASPRAEKAKRLKV